MKQKHYFFYLISVHAKNQFRIKEQHQVKVKMTTGVHPENALENSNEMEISSKSINKQKKKK